MNSNGNKPWAREIFLAAEDGQYFEREQLRELTGTPKMRKGGDIDPIIQVAGRAQRTLAKHGILVSPVKENKHQWCSKVLGWHVGKSPEVKAFLLKQQAVRIDSTQHTARRTAIGEHLNILSTKEGTRALIKEMLRLVESTYGETTLLPEKAGE